MPQSCSLSSTELAFQSDPRNWRHGPLFCLRLILRRAFDFDDFVVALREDALCVDDPRFDVPDRLLLRDEAWSACVGARFYDFQRGERREPSLVVSPRQYRRVLEAQPDGWAVFLPPMIALSSRLKRACGADEVLVFLEDFHPRKSAGSEVRPGVFLSEHILEAWKGNGD